jgi:hypothetical protein
MGAQALLCRLHQLLFGGGAQGTATRQHQRGQAAMPIQAQGAVQQPLVLRVKATTVQPKSLDLQVLFEATG